MATKKLTLVDYIIFKYWSLFRGQSFAQQCRAHRTVHTARKQYKHALRSNLFTNTTIRGNNLNFINYYTQYNDVGLIFRMKIISGPTKFYFSDNKPAGLTVFKGCRIF